LDFDRWQAHPPDQPRQTQGRRRIEWPGGLWGLILW